MLTRGDCIEVLSAALLFCRGVVKQQEQAANTQPKGYVPPVDGPYGVEEGQSEEDQEYGEPGACGFNAVHSKGF